MAKKKKPREHDNLPKKHGNISVFPVIVNGNEIVIHIVGDSEGLSYFADLVNHFAKLDVDALDIPDGERAHLVFGPEEISWKSSLVRICRGDAKGSHELHSELIDA